ncbi:tRNA (N(6)-L-threonylcarbamoyladenosine(37)-C(2))-methylthiotransferase MtaB [Chromatiales bacterium (ex Bugula neritina AB1)]|nr:tRNA (N(6)-L-threonylcarbamoyladenosine(37)-C(2))-methylthiotransferase MtaB [Chromatiales bacterium (ex Bugula neritina AB1)]
MNIHLKALGCRLNEAELESWALEFQQAGHSLVNNVDQADLTVINTCAVTREAVKKSRKTINRLRRENPTGKLVVSGCFVSTGESGSATDLGVDMVVDNKDKDLLVKRVNDRWNIPIMPEGATLPGESTLFARNRHRAFIKVQDGCRYRCSYCIVTVARGAEKSRSVSDIVAQINQLDNAGIKEAVLTGVHVGGYGSDINSNLTELVTEILKSTSVPRLRFASVEPWDLGEGFFSLFDNPRLLPHMHLPIQSGSDTVLRRMSRRCHTSEFSALVEQARAQHPDFNVTTDIIVGFPGETESEWQETLDFVHATEFGHIHIFNYSARAGTKAASMQHQIADEIKQQRSRQLHEIAASRKLAFLDRQIGSTAEVLWEGITARDSELLLGYTPNYTRVAIPVDSQAASLTNFSNTISKCRLEKTADNGQYAFASLA